VEGERGRGGELSVVSPDSPRVLEWDAEERVHQVWFPGVHADVGGGYENSDLSDIALHWMIDRACGHGLKIKASAVAKLREAADGERVEGQVSKNQKIAANRRVSRGQACKVAN